MNKIKAKKKSDVGDLLCQQPSWPSWRLGTRRSWKGLFIPRAMVESEKLRCSATKWLCIVKKYKRKEGETNTRMIQISPFPTGGLYPESPGHLPLCCNNTK